MKLHRAHSWLFTGCLLLAATPAYAQYGYAPYGPFDRTPNVPGAALPQIESPSPETIVPEYGLPSNVRTGAAPNGYTAPPMSTSLPYSYSPSTTPDSIPYAGAANRYAAPGAEWPGVSPSTTGQQEGNAALQAWAPAAWESRYHPAAMSVQTSPAPSGGNEVLNRSVGDPVGTQATSQNPLSPPGVDSFDSATADPIRQDANPHDLPSTIGNSEFHPHAGAHVPQGTHGLQSGPDARHGVTQPWKKSAPCASCGNLACGGAGCADGICGPNNGLYFQYDRVYWSISAPDTTDIGHAPAERFVTTPAGVTLFYQNDLDTSFLDGDFSTGDRFDFGYLRGTWGWAASVLHVRQRQGISADGVSYVPFDPTGLMRGYQDANGDTYDDDIDMDNLFGRHGEDLGTPDGSGGFNAPFDGTPDTPAPADTGDLVTYLVTFDSMSVQNSTEMTGAELMNVYRTIGSNSASTLDWYGGVRYLQIRDRFLISATGGFLDTTSLDTDVDNDIVGPQIGGRFARRRGSLVFSVEGRFMAGFNFQRTEQRGSVATNASPGGQNAPVSLTAHSSNRAVTDELFAPLGELRVDLAYKVNRCAAFRFGYTALVTTGIGRASEQVLYSLPEFGLNTSGNNNQTLFSNALTFGLEFNR